MSQAMPGQRSSSNHYFLTIRSAILVLNCSLALPLLPGLAQESSYVRDLRGGSRLSSPADSQLKQVILEMRGTPVGARGRLIPALLAAMSDSELQSARNWSYLRDELRDPSAVSALVAALPTRQGNKAAALLVGCRRNSGFTLSNQDTAGLIKALHSGNAVLRRDVADVLAGAAVDNNSQAKNALIETLYHDPDDKTRQEAALTLGNFGREEYYKNAYSTAGALARSVAIDGSADVRGSALWSLGEMHGKAAPAVNALARALQDNSSIVRWRAMEAIRKIGPPCKNAVPNLIELLNGPDERIAMGSSRYYACAALEGIGPYSASAFPSLVVLLNDPVNARSAARALGAIGPRASKAVPGLIKLLNSADYDDREAAAFALGNMGGAARSALPALQRAAYDTRNRLGAGNTNGAQSAAKEAIVKIAGH